MLLQEISEREEWSHVILENEDWLSGSLNRKLAPKHLNNDVVKRVYQNLSIVLDCIHKEDIGLQLRLFH